MFNKRGVSTIASIILQSILYWSLSSRVYLWSMIPPAKTAAPQIPKPLYLHLANIQNILWDYCCLSQLLCYVISPAQQAARVECLAAIKIIVWSF